MSDHVFKPTYEGHANEAIQKLRDRWHEVDSMAGVGIDPDTYRIPDEIWDKVGGRFERADGIELFNRRVIDATADQVADFKVNSNFFEGETGRRALAATFDHIKQKHPKVLRIWDGKFADVGHTAQGVADVIFGDFDADAVVVNPYLGSDAIAPFANYHNKMVIVCVKTSNPSATEIQDLKLEDGRPLWRKVLENTVGPWNYNGNLIPILSATHEDDLSGIRSEIGDTPILLAGVGMQGGDINAVVPSLLDSQGYGLMIGASRSVIYPVQEDGETLEEAWRRRAEQLKTDINTAKEAE